jgi:hypothetical protein
MGIDAEVDQFHEHDPGVDWNRFGVQAAQDQDFVLIATSRAYRERWEGRNVPTEGPGAVREADELMGQFNQNQDAFRRRVIVSVLPGASADDIPPQLSGLQRFHLEELTDEAAEDLYRTLTGQPATPKPALGPLRRMPPRRIGAEQMRAVEAAEASGASGETSPEIAELRIALSRIEAGLATVPDDVTTEAEFGRVSGPWVRAARDLLEQHVALIARLTELESAETPPAGPTARQVNRPDDHAPARGIASASPRGAVLRRGEVFDTVVDSAVYLQKLRPLPLKSEIERLLLMNVPLPQRLLYLTEEGRMAYLALCESPEYRYHLATLAFLSSNAPSLVDCVVSHCGSAKLDIISLGPGDGSKDSILLKEFATHAEPDQDTYYYPYDVSGGTGGSTTTDAPGSAGWTGSAPTSKARMTDDEPGRAIRGRDQRPARGGVRHPYGAGRPGGLLRGAGLVRRVRVRSARSAGCGP